MTKLEYISLKPEESHIYCCMENGTIITCVCFLGSGR